MRSGRSYLLRVWLPDRPGGLGAVASRVGALKGDVVGIDILERGGGAAVDEFVVVFPDDVSIDHIARELRADDEISVEEIMPLSELTYDPHVLLLDLAAEVLESPDHPAFVETLTSVARRAVRSDWAAVIGDDGRVQASSGSPPPSAWLAAFAAGSATMMEEGSMARSEALAFGLDPWSATLVVGRNAGFRTVERNRLAALARLARSHRCGPPP